eukprot:m.2140 g.2140  ORF g.2140 m.2140 type:complete len:73 (-) comp1726_c0_seq1:31-249(-)
MVLCVNGFFFFFNFGFSLLWFGGGPLTTNLSIVVSIAQTIPIQLASHNLMFSQDLLRIHLAFLLFLFHENKL